MSSTIKAIGTDPVESSAVDSIEEKTVAESIHETHNVDQVDPGQAVLSSDEVQDASQAMELESSTEVTNTDAVDEVDRLTTTQGTSLDEVLRALVERVSSEGILSNTTPEFQDSLRSFLNERLTEDPTLGYLVQRLKSTL